MGRQRLIQEYPPKSWVCPSCGKEHSKAHYSVAGQIDYTKKPGETGRILFNRRDKSDRLATDTTIVDGKPRGGEQFDEEGHQRALYCCHCGYEDSFVILIRTGDLPDLVDQFYEEEIDPSKTLNVRELLSRFYDWLKRRQSRQ